MNQSVITPHVVKRHRYDSVALVGTSGVSSQPVSDNGRDSPDLWYRNDTSAPAPDYDTDFDYLLVSIAGHSVPARHPDQGRVLDPVGEVTNRQPDQSRVLSPVVNIVIGQPARSRFLDSDVEASIKRWLDSILGTIR